MSNRERWTVYPLLFLTLGIALKDKVTRLVNTDAIVCKQLLVTDRKGQPRVILASTADGGIVETQASTPSVNVILGQYRKQAGLMFTDANNKVLRSIAVQAGPPNLVPGHPADGVPPGPPDDDSPPEQPAAPAPDEDN